MEIFFIIFFVILELENIKQDDVKVKAWVSGCGSGYFYCYSGDPVCIPSGWIGDWECDCSDCSDEPPNFDRYPKGKLDEKYLTHKDRMKDQTARTDQEINPETLSNLSAKDSEVKCWLPLVSWPCSPPSRNRDSAAPTPAPEIGPEAAPWVTAAATAPETATQAAPKAFK